MNLLGPTIFLPLGGAFLLYLLPKKSRPIAAVSLLGITAALAIFILSQVLHQRQASFFIKLNDLFSLAFTADGLGAFMAAVSCLVAFIIGIYSLEYMRDYENKAEFFFWVVLFSGAMTGLVFSQHLLLLFIFWEITSLCSWRLIGFYRKEQDLKAAEKSFLITFIGASALLAGIIIIYQNHQTFMIRNLAGVSIPSLAAFLILIGIISKSAQLPLQSWLPDAGVAPTPVTALLHAAVLVKIGVFVFARLFIQAFAVDAQVMQVALFIGMATAIVAGGCALVENNMKRILAYSTISQLGYIIAALSLGTKISYLAALIYILAHAIAKAGLFLCAGIVEHSTGTKDIRELGGLKKAMPYTAAAFLLSAFSVIGIPPFLGFWPKAVFILDSAQSGQIGVSIFACIGAVLTLLYLIRLFSALFLGELKIAAQESKKSVMLWVVLFLGALSLIMGIFFQFAFNLTTTIARI